ncbi:MAG: DUF86 domain-containing protein, partial [Candidatus Aureabacteria bacterium]|nr:DUF86 domain-containing protein [Candidatus Auribacterota bacterium]
TQGGRDIFMQSSEKQDAVIRNFEIVGEAVKRISLDLTRLHPEIPWKTFPSQQQLMRRLGREDFPPPR